ncbi:hypothetical protein BS78_01G137000 [Paspalum vaginatum]|nr:hypothetical protein BS78_01G137000 [Paspalum vaginatum]
MTVSRIQRFSPCVEPLATVRHQSPSSGMECTWCSKKKLSAAPNMLSIPSFFFLSCNKNSRHPACISIQSDSVLLVMSREIPVQHRGDAVSSLVYEANARVRDPVYGCVGAISSLQQQVEALQAQLALAQAEMVRLKMSNDYIVHRLRAARGGGGGSSYTGSPSSMSSPKTAEPEAHCKATPELLDMVVDQPASMDDAPFWSY